MCLCSSILGSCKEQLNSGSSHPDPGGLALRTQSHGQAGAGFVICTCWGGGREGEGRTDQRRQPSRSRPQHKLLGREPLRKILVCFSDWALAEGHLKGGADSHRMVTAVPRKEEPTRFLNANRRERNIRHHQLFLLLTATNFLPTACLKGEDLLVENNFDSGCQHLFSWRIDPHGYSWEMFPFCSQYPALNTFTKIELLFPEWKGPDFYYDAFGSSWQQQPGL